MNKVKVMVLVLTCIFIAPLSVAAGDFDGSKPLICAITETVECGAEGDCQQGEAQSINLPQILNINFKKEEISGTREDGEVVTTRIEKITSVEGMIILQGVENGKGWSMAITKKVGKVTRTASGDQAGFIAFGVCIPDPVTRKP